MWLGVACEITEGKYIYLFEGMRSQTTTREAVGRSRKIQVEDDLELMVIQMEQRMSFSNK